VRLFFQEDEWALSSSWSGEAGDFFSPELTNVSNLGHPLFSRLGIPYVVLNFGGTPDEATHRVPIDADHFHCGSVSILSNGNSTTVETWPGLGGNASTPPKVPGPLSGGLSNSVYGHTAQNDLSLWASEYIRIFYDLRDGAIRDLLKGAGKDPHYLRIELLFQFGPYSNEPAHEPSGMLHSARLIPAISFQTDSPYLRRLRFDVQCDPRLESLDMELKKEGFPAIAILTRDSEILDPATPARIARAKEREGKSRKAAESEATAAAAFDKIEKPLLFEICSSGWRDITPPASPPRAAPTPAVQPAPGAGPGGSLTSNEGAADPPIGGTPLWDNVHVAPAKRVGDGWLPRLPSAPGAYYALHCHWRWGAMLSDFWYLYNNSPARRAFSRAMTALFPQFHPAIDPMTKLAYVQFMDAFFHALHPDGRDAQYRGLPITANAGGPLLDPNLPHQTIQLAIVKSGHAWIADTVRFAFVDDFLTGKSGKPDPIDAGESLSWWLSFAVERPRASDLPNPQPKSFGGTLFAHGMHFAHNLFEPTQIFGRSGALSSQTIGLEAHVPSKVAQEWER
jgi:hypothetical protein